MVNVFLFQANPGNGLGHSRNLRSVIVVSSHDCPLLVKADSHPNRTTTVMTAPRGIPLFIHISSTCLPANSEGVSYRHISDLHVITVKLLAIGTRAAICGVLCPGVLPCPCPGQHAHQGALTDREGRKLEITWMTALLPKPGQN
jgi:hypothetical protein